MAAQAAHEFVGPCGNCACEKYADCAYCVTCIEADPWAQEASEADEDFMWEVKHEGSFADWLYA